MQRVFIILPVVLGTMGSAGAATAQVDRATQTHLEAILADYEVVRDALANDRGAPVAAAARNMASRATRAASSARGDVRTRLQTIASKSRALASTSANDMAALRRKFGEVSEPLVAIVRATPALRRGRHLFNCPMAQGYGEWIQRTDEIANPYMGQRMLMCGAARDW